MVKQKKTNTELLSLAVLVSYGLAPSWCPDPGRLYSLSVQFASDLDEASKEQLEHGERVTELTKQDQFSPMSVAEMGLMLFTANEGYLRKVEVEKIKDFEKSLIAYMNAEHKELMDKVSETGEYGDDIQSAFTEALDKFMETQTW